MTSAQERPFAGLPDDALRDEIAITRIYAQGRDLKQVRAAKARLAELLGEQGQRGWLDNLPF